MSRCSELVLWLFVAACEQYTPSQNPPVYPEPPTAPAAVPEPAVEAAKPTAPTPVPEPVVEAAKPEPLPAVAPVTPRPAPTRATPKPATPLILEQDQNHPPGKGHWSSPGCRPGSRMACRWVPDGETDERAQPRVKKVGDPNR